MKEYYIFHGNYSEFTYGKKAKGLHLNKVIRDVLRQCGYPCFNCNEDNCSTSVLDLCDYIQSCATGTGNTTMTVVGTTTTFSNGTNSLAFDAGTFTPTVTNNGGFTLVSATGFYQRVGDIMTYHGRLRLTGTNGGVNSIFIELPNVNTTVPTIAGTVTMYDSANLAPVTSTEGFVENDTVSTLKVTHNIITDPVVSFSVQYQIN